MSPILVVGALLGQMKLPKPRAEKAASLFGLSEAEKRMLNEVPMRGTPMPPTDPLLYRLYELVMVNGPALKALIEEEFGDGIMSAIGRPGWRAGRARGRRQMNYTLSSYGLPVNREP
jgi:cyanate lyase